ncbi:MAG: hypothetical protein V5A39_03095 [Haloarculaceae archaeon]
MLRVVVAVALAAALLGASMPAVDAARVDNAEARVGAEIEGLARTAERLQKRNDPSPPGVPGARRTVTLHMPGPSWGSASLDYLSIPGSAARPGASDHTTVTWRVQGGRRVTRRLSVPLSGPGTGLTIQGGGSRRIVLELTRRDGEPVVLARRPEFKSDDRASLAHDLAGLGSPRPAVGRAG